MKEKKVKSITTTLLLIAAIVQGPLFYYYASGFIKLLTVPLYGLFGLCFTVYLIVYVIKYRGTSTLYHYFGGIIAFTLGLFTINGNLMESIDWRLRFEERNRIVEEVKQGKLKPNSPLNNGICKLPGSYFFPISNGGDEIWIRGNKEDLEIEFFTDRGFIDHYSAFVYSSKKLSNSPFSQVIKPLSEHWYEVHY